MRGSRTTEKTAVVLLAAMDHTGTVLAQRQIADKSNEIPAFATLLDAIENLDGVVITADALHTQHAHGAHLRSRGAHYLAIVKKNHAKLHDQVRHLPWRDMPLEHYDRTRAHHRIEIRRLKAAAFDHLDYPDAKQALQITRWRLDRATGELTIERIYLITSLAPGTATAPNSLPGSEATGASRTICTTSATGPSARTTPRSAPVICPAPWPPCATSPSGFIARTVPPTWPRPFDAPPATTAAP
ncbi:ISAs1 family transposase [Streptomyces sp. P01-B04]|uniref:ISAs1 family transposase n=1 Tax=Streptomyces poriferorum TaxID=2798799 RepID=UPI001C5E379D|nr:ISAs1 family transposase [Streptomyces poriferorum]MBW5249968.1 ISAs1 family transposase [Streptomyces poriferorum]MBW5257137.1 ISAs1 family transposase [Streptomyces poriferorum]